MMESRTIRIAKGRVQFVYDDRLHASLGKLGRVSITRASSVEFDHERGGWMADLSPTIPGCVLGPFESRTAAVAAEHARLEKELRRDVQAGTDPETHARNLEEG